MKDDARDGDAIDDAMTRDAGRMDAMGVHAVIASLVGRVWTSRRRWFRDGCDVGDCAPG